MLRYRYIIEKELSPTSSFQNLSVSLRTVGQRKRNDLIVSREFDLYSNQSSASHKTNPHSIARHGRGIRKKEEMPYILDNN